MFTKILKSRFYPAGLRWFTVLFFVPIVGVLLFGEAASDNPANLMVWLIWWPLLCLLFLFAGRIWCGVCPFSLLSDWTQRFAGVRMAAPDFLKRHGGWMILIAFLLLSWLEETAGIMNSPPKTAALLLTILTGAVAFGLFFRGRAWCRYVCPLGGISLVYARAALFKIRADEAACGECVTKDCVVTDAQYDGCPMHMTPFAMASVANCNVCGACVKRCANSSLKVAFEAPSRDLSDQSTASPAVVWLIVILAGLISFLNSLESGRLPVEEWLQHSAHPVLIKTVLFSGTLAGWFLLFVAMARLADNAMNTVPRPQRLLFGALPMIPLLLFSHLGHVSSELWADGGDLFAPLAVAADAPWLRLDALWGSSWTAYFSPFCILLGMALTLGVLWWSLTRAKEDLPVRRYGLCFGLFYIVFAGWNLFVTWPLPAAPEIVIPESVKVSESITETIDGWAIVWLFAGINGAFLALALIIRRFEVRSDAAAESADFSATRSWLIRSKTRTEHGELLEWLVEKANQAHWSVPAVVRLSNATSEIIVFLQRTLPDGAEIAVNAILRKNKGVLSIAHEGRPLSLPDYKAPSNIDEVDDAALAGLELRLAVAQVDYMSYQARLSDIRCSFTLRQKL